MAGSRQNCQPQLHVSFTDSASPHDRSGPLATRRQPADAYLWMVEHRPTYTVVTSQPVLMEAAACDPDAAAGRLSM
jgi:hypothetical protein